MDEHRGGEFTGYMIRKLEEKLERVEARSKMHLDRIEKKVDALAQDLTPAERGAIIAKINEETAKLNAMSDAANAIVTKLDKTGV